MPPKRPRGKPYTRQRNNARDVTGESELVQLDGSDKERSGTNSVNPFTQLLLNSGTKSSAMVQTADFEIPENIIRCVDDDMSMHVTSEVCSKIWPGEFVNYKLS